MRLLERTMVKFWKTEKAFKIVPSCACIDGEVTKLELVSCPFYVRFRSTSTNLWLFQNLWLLSYDRFDSDITTWYFSVKVHMWPQVDLIWPDLTL